MTALRIALRLAWSPDPRQRWRQLSVSASAVLTSFLVLAGVALIGAAQHAQAVVTARSPVWAESADATLEVAVRGLTIEGRQFPVVWLNPVTGFESDPTSIPPGLSSLPGPGEAVLSPGLIAAGFEAADFGLATSQAGLGADGAIGSAGVLSLSEGWIYARPNQGRSLGESPLLTSGYGLHGERVTQETEADIPLGASMTVMVLWLVILPAMVLLMTGARALSPVRLSRATLLHRLGISRANVRWMLAIETAALLLPGLLLGALAWLLASPHVGQVPLTGTILHAGALTTVPLATFGLVMGLLAVGAFAGALVRPNRGIRRRSRAASPWQLAPLAMSLTMMGISQFFDWNSSTRQTLLFGGLLLTFVTLPVAVPALVARSGRLLAQSRNAARWLAGRRLAYSSSTLARPAIIVGLLVFIAGGAFAMYAQMITPEAEQRVQAPVTAFSVHWADPQPGDFELAEVALEDLTVLPVTESNAVIAGTCSDLEPLAQSLGVVACDQAGTPTSELVRYANERMGLQISLGGEAESAEGTTLHLLAFDSTGQWDERQVMQALAEHLPAPNISINSATSTVPRTVGWLIAGWALATLILTATMMREIGDRAISAITSDAHVIRLGLKPGEVRRVQRWTLLGPLATSVPLGYAGAVAYAVMGNELGYTARSLTPITVVAAVAALLAAIVMAAAFRLAPKPGRPT